MFDPASLASSRRAFVALALLWLPAVIAATAVFRGMGVPVEPQAWLSLVFVAPCGLPLALGCRRLWQLGYRRAAWWAGIGLGAVTALASLVAGLLGPLAIAVYAAIISLPVWIAWSLLRRSR